MPDTFVTVPKPIVDERSSFSATSYFRSGESASAPTTAHYRIDCLATGTTIVDWTSLSAAVSITIPVTSANNKIQGGNRLERKQMTVAADKGTTTETRDVVTWQVRNIGGFNE